MSTAVPSVSPWAKVVAPIQTQSLKDVMSEQLADQLHKDEIRGLQDDVLTNASQTTNEALENQPVDNDFVLASLLQLEFDKEYDEVLKRYENTYNRNSKVSMSYDKFKIVHPIVEKEEKAKDVDTLEQEYNSDNDDDDVPKLVFKNGIHGKGENMISKHDLALSGKRNASRVMNFPPEFETGDAHGIKMSLSNAVFNTLKVHSMHEQRRNNRLHDKHEKATAELALDPKTRILLFKLVNSEVLESIGGVISTGKEALILFAPGGKSKDLLVPSECVAKVYKTTLNEFKTRSKYIKDDYRFKDRYKHLNPRKIVRLWAEKEMHNLMKIRNYGILCPEVVALKKHVLIMSFVGTDGKAAPKLKDAALTPEQLKDAYEQTIQILKDLYHKCNLVHADFSEYNLLWHENKVWVIDVSQSIEHISSLGLEFLYRDCGNIVKFFNSRKLENILTQEELFNFVTEQNFSGSGVEFLSQIHTYTKNKQIEIAPPKDEKAYNFDYFFEKTMKDRKERLNLDSSDDDDDDDDDDVYFEDEVEEKEEN